MTVVCPDKTEQHAGPRLLDLKAAATYLGLSYWTVRDLVIAGRLPSVKIPCPRSRDGRTIRRVLVDRHDLDTFIEQSKEFAA
jgi:excisionase family DNA binding protein